MTSVANRRSMMNLYSGNICIRSHQARFVLSEKGIVTQINNFDGNKIPEDLIALNPFATLPTLVDRELVLYDSRVIIEYIDERYPYPPLLPVSPVDRAKIRLALASLEVDIVQPAVDLDQTMGARTENSHRKKLRSALNATSDLFSVNKYFLSEDFTIIDCVLGPILWRLDYFKINLTNDHKHMKDYMQRVFDREAFQDSLTEDEEEMHL